MGTPSTTLTDLLRSQTDEELAALLRARPDLVAPVPPDLATLAARVQSRSSVARALDRLDRFQLEILDALRLTREPDQPTSLDEVLAITAAVPAGADSTAVRAAVHRLRDLALVYGSEQALRVVPTVDEVLGPYPGGLGRPAAELGGGAAGLVADPARLRRTLLSAPPAARAMLDRLATGPPVGTTTADQVGDPSPDTPVGWLVSRGLLVTTTDTTVELPREVGILLRRDAGPLGPLHPRPVAPAAPPRDPSAVDAAGAGQVMEAVRMTAALLAALAEQPAPILRAGGMGLRELRRLARTVDLPEPVTAFLAEVAYAAALIGEADNGKIGEFRPTARYDGWTGLPIATQWHALATSWLGMPRQPAPLDQPQARLANPLHPDAAWSGALATRRTVLGVLATLPAGTAPTGDEVRELVSWHHPRRPPGGDRVLAEAALLGITGQGALTSYGAALVAETDGRLPVDPDRDPLGLLSDDTEPEPAEALPGRSRAEARLHPLLPEPVGEMLVQADLTVVVPGPPEPALAAELELVTEQESAGGASVHRVTRDSVRRALDTGYAAEDLHALFARRSRTPVPQGLSYLIDDVARAHGGLRAGSAGAYLRSDDEALIAQALTDRRLAGLGLRRLAPTVLITTAGSGRLLTALREAGYTPVPEDASGAAVLVAPRVRRAPAREPEPLPVGPATGPRVTTPQLLGIVEDIRRGDAAARVASRAPAAVRANGAPTTGLAGVQAHTEAMAVLQQAVRDKALVWVGYVDGHGETASRLLRPVSIGAGYLRAEDERTDTLHTLALHRITAAALD